MKRTPSFRELAFLVAAALIGIGGAVYFVLGRDEPVSIGRADRPPRESSEEGKSTVSVVRRPDADYRIIAERNLIRTSAPRIMGTNSKNQTAPVPVRPLPGLLYGPPGPEQQMLRTRELPPAIPPPAVTPTPNPATPPTISTGAPEPKVPEVLLILRVVLDIDGKLSAIVEELQGGKREGPVHAVRVGDTLSGGTVVAIRTTNLVWEKDGEQQELLIDQPTSPRKIARDGGRQSEGGSVEIRVEQGGR